MGALYRFDLQPWIYEYKLLTYFETGLGWAESLRWALRYPFEQYFSVDLDIERVNESKYLEQEHNVKIIHDYSTNALKKYLPKIGGNILFFLDAHVMGADGGKISYEESLRTYKEHALPLVNELRIISESTKFSNHVYILDDMCIYNSDLKHDSMKDGITWKCKDLQQKLGLETSMDQILPFFENHNIVIDSRDQGYLIATPKT